MFNSYLLLSTLKLYVLDRLAKTSASSSGSLSQSSSTARWRILCEEVSTAGAVSAVEAEKALQLLLDSERVYEDLEYALRGPSGKKGAVAVTGNGSQGSILSSISPGCASLYLRERYQGPKMGMGMGMRRRRTRGGDGDGAAAVAHGYRSEGLGS